MALTSLLARIPQDQRALFSGLAAFGSAEVANRVVRVFAIVVIARRIDAAELGSAALTLSLFELIRVLANAGIGQCIVAASDSELTAVCNRARHLFWIWCSLVALIQLTVALVVWRVFGLTQAGAMLALLAGVYFTMPGGLVQIFLLMREGRLGAAARIGAVQTMADHALTMTLALLWPSAWAIVLPKLLTTPIWLAMARRAYFWRPDRNADLAPTNVFLRYGTGVLASELAVAARLQLGNLVIGATLGLSALGTYYFAFNAGLGITASFVSAFTTVLFPQLCAARTTLDRHRRFVRGLRFGLLLFLPVLLTQIALAQVYVPILFGPRWAFATGLVAMLALGAFPLILGAATTALLRAERRTGTDAAITALTCIVSLAGLTIGTAWGLNGAALGYVAGLAIVLIPAAVHFLAGPVRRHQEQFA